MSTRRMLEQAGPGAVSAHSEVDGFALHHVSSGDGPPLLLLHGFPQDWSEWRHVMARLADRFRVVAPDLPGVGGSDSPAPAYDAASLADQVAGLIEALEVGPVHVAGHDLGGWVAYSLARRRPDLVRTLSVLETLLPGIEPSDAPPLQVSVWHAEFQMLPGLPEALVTDRQEVYVRHFLETGTADEHVPTDDEIAHQASAYGDPSRLAAAFEPYRAIAETAAANTGATSTIEVPLLLVGGEECFGPQMAPLAGTLRRDHGWTDVGSAVIDGARHYLPEEKPEEVANLLAEHASRA